MYASTYFKKNGKIYGISEKYSFGRWVGYALEFTSLEDAQDWLHTEEFDFRERRLCSLTEVRKSGYILSEYVA